MHVKKLLAAAIAAQFVLGASSAGAQEQQPPAPPPPDTVFYVAGAAPIMPLGGAIEVLSPAASVLGGVVKGKPYSAESVTESTQMLADGNRITTTNRARVYRDSEGRTRREQQLDAIGVWQSNEPVSMITINDPVSGASYFVDPRTETVRNLRPMRLELNGGAAVQGEVGNVMVQERIAVRAGELEAGLQSAERPPRQVIQATRELRAGVPGAEPVIAPNPGAAAVRLATPPTAVSFGVGMARGIGETVTEELGEQVLEGVLARGTRTTTTIPAGAIGNELPIEVVHEEWYSPDIEAVVLRRDFDPRFGETTYRLVNVDRSEPPPELFMIPQDYEVLEQRVPTPGVRVMPGSGAVEARDGSERGVIFVRPAAPPAPNDR